MRLGYTLMEEDLYRKYTRLLGLVLVAAGVASLVAGWLGLDQLALFLTVLVPGYIVVVAAARREAHFRAAMGRPVAGEQVKLTGRKPGIALLAPPLLLLALAYHTGTWVAGLVQALLLLLLLAARWREPVVFYNPWVPPETMFRLLYVALLASGLAGVAASTIGSRGALIAGAMVVLVAAGIVVFIITSGRSRRRTPGG